jgi:riboflavin synthase
MFTGIIQTIGQIERIESEENDSLFSVAIQDIGTLTLGESVAIDGVCLTAARQEGKEIWFDVMKETVKKTTLGMKRAGDPVNIERALCIGDALGGHLVYGHVDGVGEVLDVKREGESLLLTIALPEAVAPYIVETCSVAIDGVSLTVARTQPDRFVVSLVDYTETHTTLGKLRAGDIVNIEADMLAKYTRRMLGARADMINL